MSYYARLELEARNAFEMREVSDGEEVAVTLHSIAISLKRIADLLEPAGLEGEVSIHIKKGEE